MSLITKIKEYYKKGYDKKKLLFTTPSHGQGQFIPQEAKKMLGKKFFKCDFSEIEGFDNLRCPEDVLKEVLDKFSKIYNSKQTFLLTNGSTSGNIALLMSVLNSGDKVLVARNCHISIFNALVVIGAIPVWFLPEYDKEWGIYGGVNANTVDNHLSEDENIKAVVITSPTYEGLFSNVEKIAAVCKKHDVRLIVDEAHGALLNFGEFKTKPAILCGADASVQSLHKTAGAPNPCALLHIAKNSKICPQRVQDCLNVINTTSPSYPLMLATEICVDYLNSKSGRKQIADLVNYIKKTKTKLSENITVYDNFNDLTKILVKVEDKNGLEIASILNEKYNIEEEFSTETSLLFLCGIGTTHKKIDKMFSALEQISKNIEPKPCKASNDFEIPTQKFAPKEAFSRQNNTKTVKKKECIGCICAETIIDYPPGIPIIVSGEVISENVLKFIKQDEIKVFDNP